MQGSCSNCVVCVWPEFSVLVTVTFLLGYLGVLAHVMGRMARAAVNRGIRRRTRLLQVRCVATWV